MARRLAVWFYEATSEMRWSVLLCLLAIHMGTTWMLFAFAGESEVSRPDVFPYFYAVTVSTIGYGDFSPKTGFGRAVLAAFAVPGGLALFGVFLGKSVTDAGQRWRMAMQGRKSYADLIGHTVVFGWEPHRGPRLLRFLSDDAAGSREIVLVAVGIDENPLPDLCRFVSVASLSGSDSLSRSGVAGACVAVVAAGSDEATLTTGLAVASLPVRPRIVAYFDDDEKAALFERNVPDSECTVALASEMLARSARDPGSSDMQRRMLSLHDDDTQFSAVVPPGPDASYGQVFACLRKGHRATAIGLMREVGHPDVNPPDDRTVRAGDTVFYIAPTRIAPADWGETMERVRSA